LHSRVLVVLSFGQFSNGGIPDLTVWDDLRINHKPQKDTEMVLAHCLQKHSTQGMVSLWAILAWRWLLYSFH